MIPIPHPYPTYKPSNVQWLGNVPAHWEVRRLRDSTVDCVNGVWGSDPDGIHDLACVRVADFDRHRLRVRHPIPTMRAIEANERRRRMLRSGDLLLEKSGGGDQQPVGVVVLYDHDSPAVCSNFIGKLTVRRDFDPPFLTFLHSTLYSTRLNTRSIKQTTGIQNLDSNAYLSEIVAFPPLPEQRAIVRYLDHVDERIRGYVSAKERLIALLEEERQAVIHRAVTRGLDPNVPLKPSGVEWLGDVPVHWEVRRLGDSIAANVNGVWGSEPNGIDDLPCVRVADFDRHRLRVRRPIPTLRAIEPHERPRRILQPGDLLLEKSGGGDQQPVGVVILFDHDVPAVCSNFIGRMVIRNNFEPRFLTLLHSTLYAIRLNTRSIKQTTGIQNLDSAAYLSEAVAFPPLPEQNAIVQHLDKATADIDAAIERARRRIELLREYRTRLIADVVTGKLDVRETAAELPEEARQ